MSFGHSELAPGSPDVSTGAVAMPSVIVKAARNGSGIRETPYGRNRARRKYAATVAARSTNTRASTMNVARLLFFRTTSTLPMLVASPLRPPIGTGKRFGGPTIVAATRLELAGG